ncbi:MAG: transcriptional regulator [Methylacidiphilales bacterium]|nr:transcriptional regulator [Candidatus Methylacidiphilales bacterium]
MTHASQAGAAAVDALLADYAAGALRSTMSVLVEAHLELSPVNRRFVHDLEAVGGMLLDEAPPVAIADRDARLAAILADDTPRVSIRARPRPPADPVLPGSLRRFIGRPFSEIAWKSKLPGLKECHLDSEDGEASLLWIRAGQAMPSHTHTGLEAVLVLKGGFIDIDGHYVRGDIAVADESTDHKPVADDDEDCICFVVEEGHVKLTGLLGRIFQRIAGQG